MPRPASAARVLLTAPSPDIFAPAGPSGIYQGAGIAQSVVMLVANPVESFVSADAVIGIGNIWSIETWVYWTSSLPVGNQSVFNCLPAAGNANDIGIGTNGGTGEISVLTRDSAAANLSIKRYPQNSWTVDAWNMLTITRESSLAGSTRAWMNGVELTASGVSTDNAGTMTNTSRVLRTPVPIHEWDGFMFGTTVWDVALSAAEMLYRFDNQAGLSVNGWLDPTVDQGDYASSAGNIHWWPFALNVGNLGEDAAGALDLTGSNIVLGSNVP
jgi:hypothetical protein